MRILIVDDEDTVRTTVAANLELELFDVVEARNAAQAIALVQQERIDLVLSDIRMPDMDGVDLFRSVRRIRADLPVVLMTAFAREERIEAAFREGVFTVVPKPFEIDHLISILVRAGSQPLVLLVNPESAAAATLETLQAAGVRCDFSSQKDAMLRIRQEMNVDICIVHLASTTSDGLPLVSQIQAVAPATAIIGVVPAGRQGLAADLAGLDAYAYIDEPYEPVELVRLIARARGRTTRPPRYVRPGMELS